MYSNNYRLVRNIKVNGVKKKNFNYSLENSGIIYLYLDNNSGGSLLSSRYLYRLELFIKLCKFFKSSHLNYQMLMRVFYSRFYNVWLIFTLSGERGLYYIILKNTIKLYKKLFLSKIGVKTLTYITQPNHFLVELPLSATGRGGINPLLTKSINDK